MIDQCNNVSGYLIKGSKMRLVYLAAPYRATAEHSVYLNIHNAGELALQVWKLGAACICPQKNTAFYGGEAPDELWLEGDLEILRRCDAILLGPGGAESPGTRNEVNLANELKIPVFTSITDLAEWLQTEPES